MIEQIIYIGITVSMTVGSFILGYKTKIMIDEMTEEEKKNYGKY